MSGNPAGPSRRQHENDKEVEREYHGGLHDDLEVLPEYEEDHLGQSLLRPTCGPSSLKGSTGSNSAHNGDVDYEVEDGIDLGDSGQTEMERGHERHRHASLALKRTLWWRNVIITGMFILSW